MMTAESYYDPGKERAAKVNALFKRIAPRYDLINDLQSFCLHRVWKRRVVSLARVRPGTAALDVCCGTGDLAFALSRKGAQVVGLDFSEEMLRVAENRKRRFIQSATGPGKSGNTPGGRQPEFMQGDAQAMPFPAASFDVVTVGYGLRNLADLEVGLREMQRVLRRGGRMLVLDFGKPENALWRKMYFAYLRFVVPWFGRIFCGSASAYAYILESLEHYPAQTGIAARMRELGLVNVRIVNLLGGVMSINYADKP